MKTKIAPAPAAVHPETPDGTSQNSFRVKRYRNSTMRPDRMLKKKTKALLLNALLMPGLGQIYLGKRRKGAALVVAINILLLAGLFLLLRTASPLIAAQTLNSVINPDEIATALESSVPFAKGIFACFALLWGYALIDIFYCKRD